MFFNVLSKENVGNIQRKSVSTVLLSEICQNITDWINFSTVLLSENCLNITNWINFKDILYEYQRGESHDFSNILKCCTKLFKK